MSENLNAVEFIELMQEIVKKQNEQENNIEDLYEKVESIREKMEALSIGLINLENNITF